VDRSVELYLLRHAHAGDPAAWEGPDERRPLSTKGVAQAERLARLLADAGFAPDIVITSPALRAVQTAEAVAARLGRPVRVDERLAPGFDRGSLEAVLHDAGDPLRPVLVGHDPDFSDLLGALTDAPVTLRKGALARVDGERPLQPGGGTLRWLIPPDLLARKG
jgi:phosphohistidine phosphatase